MSAREDFTKAAQAVVWYMPIGTWRREHMLAMVDAFADAVCEPGGDSSTCRLATEGTQEEHAACRATLRRECGLDGGVQP